MQESHCKRSTVADTDETLVSRLPRAECREVTCVRISKSSSRRPVVGTLRPQRLHLFLKEWELLQRYCRLLRTVWAHPRCIARLNVFIVMSLKQTQLVCAHLLWRPSHNSAGSPSLSVLASLIIVEHTNQIYPEKQSSSSLFVALEKSSSSLFVALDFGFEFDIVFDLSLDNRSPFVKVRGGTVFHIKYGPPRQVFHIKNGPLGPFAILLGVKKFL